jgi:hypothetical protein
MITNAILGLLIFFFLINPLFGTLIWTICDDEDQTLKKWLDSCPKEIEWFALPLILSAWPVAVKWWMDNKEGPL